MKNRKTFPFNHLWIGVLITLSAICPQRSRAIDIVVANNADSGNGTLRQAIQFNESLGGGNTIVFSNVVTGTITLTNVLGELLISKDVTITGPGANLLAINGNAPHRVLHVTNNAAVGISGLTIQGGHLVDLGVKGAAILQDSGTLSLSNCAIANNRNEFGPGGGIAAIGTVTASQCTFYFNSSMGVPGGGAVYMTGQFTAINCTFSGNSSFILQGGAINNAGGVLALTNCTISANSALSGSGGGIYQASGTAIIRNTIIAGNLADQGPDSFGAFTSAGFNLVGAINDSTGWNGLGDQLGTTNSPLNPLLGPPQDNGGPTITLAPQFGSPVIDQGNSSGIFTDQRGQVRPCTNNPVSSIPLGGGSWRYRCGGVSSGRRENYCSEQQ